MASTSQRDALLKTIEQKAHLNDRFEAIQRIGADGGGGYFSLVLEAHDRETKQKVALKFFDPTKRNDAYRWESFKREVDLLPRFSGKRDILQCVCPLTEFKEPFEHALGIVIHVDFAYYAVELAKYDVSAAIVGNQWSAKEKLEYFRLMCRSVARVHRESIVHRDLKPSNFLVMPDGTLRLSDFGTARHLSSKGLLANYGFPPGDIRYLSPEMVALLHDVDPAIAFKADIYALGAILFELFTGTVLNVHIFDPVTRGDLARLMGAVAPEQRVQVYNGFVGALAAGRPLPSVDLFGPQTPPCIVELVNRLYRAMAALDHRERLCDFGQIFMHINRCAYVLEHEAAYYKWREQKRLRKGKGAAKRG